MRKYRNNYYNQEDYIASPYTDSSKFTKDKNILFKRMLIVNKGTLEELFKKRHLPSVEKIIDVINNCGLDVLGFDVGGYDYMCYDMCPSHTVLCVYLPFILNDPVDRRNKLIKAIKKVIDDSDELFYGFNYEIYYYKDEK